MEGGKAGPPTAGPLIAESSKYYFGHLRARSLVQGCCNTTLGIAVTCV